MKGFLITIACFIGAAVLIMTQFARVGDWYWDKLHRDEGGSPPSAEFQTLSYEKPDAFKAKFEPVLLGRLRLAKLADLFNQQIMFVSVTAETLDLYIKTPLGGHMAMAELVYRKADYTWNTLKQPYEAYTLYKQVFNDFPTYKDAEVAKSAALKLRISYSYPD